MQKRQGGWPGNDRAGHATGTFIGRFSIETFAVAPGVAPAPSSKDAAAAGCPGTVTPFNGEHHAGVQALSTRNFPAQAGSLRQIH